MRNKIPKKYLSLGSDESGIKWYFDNEEYHFTIRLAWNPILLLEYCYRMNWGEDFFEAYEKIKKWENHKDEQILKESVIKIKEFIKIIEEIHKAGKSSLVLYTNQNKWIKNF